MKCWTVGGNERRELVWGSEVFGELMSRCVELTGRPEPTGTALGRMAGAGGDFAALLARRDSPGFELYGRSIHVNEVEVVEGTPMSIANVVSKSDETVEWHMRRGFLARLMCNPEELHTVVVGDTLHWWVALLPPTFVPLVPLEADRNFRENVTSGVAVLMRDEEDDLAHLLRAADPASGVELSDEAVERIVAGIRASMGSTAFDVYRDPYALGDEELRARLRPARSFIEPLERGCVYSVTGVDGHSGALWEGRDAETGRVLVSADEQVKRRRELGA
jgi:hypothetical protein